MPVALLVPALQLLNPLPGVVTQGVHPGHPAIDIACMPGAPVRAAHDGQGGGEYSYTHGNTFVLHGPDGLETRYSHLSAVRPSGSYHRGDVIGNCGSTGIWSSGPHLHFESNEPELLGSLVNDDAQPSPLVPGFGHIGGSPAALKAKLPPLLPQR